MGRPIRIDLAGLAHAPSYWAETAGQPPTDHGALQGDVQTDVAVIGAGFTGLSAAYYLAKVHGHDVTVLDANRMGWGGSGRNGGFAMICVGKDGYSETLASEGLVEAKQTFRLGLDAVETVEEIIGDNAIDVNRSEKGWICIAHKPSRMPALQATHDLLKREFGYSTCIASKDELTSTLIGSREAHGAIIYLDGFGLHPLKYVLGLGRAAIRHGAKVHSASPVIAWTKSNGRHVLRTPLGTVSAKQVLIGTGGYTLDQLNPWVAGRIMPAISNILVTRQLSQEEQKAAGLLTTTVVSDTRKLVFYYRLLPDGRFLFGARGGLRDNPVQNKAAYARMIRRLGEQFPALGGIEVTHFWRGWVCLSRDENPHIGTTDDPSVHYALAYMGNGVALASHFGKLAADRIAGRPSGPSITALRKPLPRFEFPSLRGALLRAAYLGYGLKDRL